MINSDFYYAMGLTLIAGMSTGIGSLISITTRKTDPGYLALSLGFSAGVMIYVSFVELLNNAKEILVSNLGNESGGWMTLLAFAGGIAVIALIDFLVPEYENPHATGHAEPLDQIEKNIKLEKSRLARLSFGKLKRVREPSISKSESFSVPSKSSMYRLGLFSTFAIAIHNFPEGIATFISAMDHPVTGLSIAVAVAIHNIPEGMAVSVPIYYATGSRRRALFLSALSGFAEPLGALLGFFVLYPFMTPVISGALLAAVAGIMVYISLDELLPSAEKFGQHHLAIYGLIAGMLLMGVTLLVLGE